MKFYYLKSEETEEITILLNPGSETEKELTAVIFSYKPNEYKVFLSPDSWIVPGHKLKKVTQRVLSKFPNVYNNFIRAIFLEAGEELTIPIRGS